MSTFEYQVIFTDSNNVVAFVKDFHNVTQFIVDVFIPGELSTTITSFLCRFFC